MARAALPIPDHPDGPINDYANALSPEAKQRLNQQLLSYELGTTRQIAIAIFPTLDDEEIEDFTIHLAEKWKIGSKKNNDGVLMTVFIKEHRDRIEVGYGLEDRLTDVQATRILRDLVRPRFKEGDFEGGLRAAIAAIDNTTGGHDHPEGRARRWGEKDFQDLIGFLVFGIFFALVAWLGRRNRGGGGGGGFFVGGASGWSSSDSSSSSDSGWSGGGGDFGGGGASGDW